MERKNNRSPHWIFYVIAALLALIAVLLALLLLKPDAPQPDSATIGQNVGAAPSDMETEDTDPGIPLDGRWTTLYLPRDLEQTVTAVRTETDTNVVLSFHTRIGEKDLELFSIELSTQKKDDYQLGVLSDTRDGNIYVYTSVNEQPAQTWSQEELAGIEALQQRINDLISQFYEDARFQAEH